MVRGPSCIRSRQIHPPPSRVPRAIFSPRTTLHRTATLFGHLPHLLVVPGTAHRVPDVARARVRHHTARASFMLCCADARAAVGRQATKRAATFFCLLSFRRCISKARSLFFALLGREQTVEQHGRIRQESGGTGHHSPTQVAPCPSHLAYLDLTKSVSDQEGWFRYLRTPRTPHFQRRPICRPDA